MAHDQIEILQIEIAKMQLDPQDVLVVNFPGKITSSEVTHTAKAIRQLLPNTKILISSDGIIFSVISQNILCEECKVKVLTFLRF